MIRVRVPATSANIGPGFDSLGLALSLYNYVSVEEIYSGLKIEIPGPTGKFLPKDEKNLVYRSMKEVFSRVGYTPSGLHLVLENNIPVTRGLGSSSACIVGGLFAANALLGNPLSRDELLCMAANIEGHADNVTPAVLGGFTTCVFKKQGVSYVRHDLKNDLKFAVLVPDFRLSTKKSRAVLPRFVSYKDAVYNTSHSALLSSSLITGKYENIRVAIGDRLHQGYRKRLIPGMDEIFRLSYKFGALGVYLSGAGPTLISIIDASNTDFNASLSHTLNKKMNNWNLSILEADNMGAVEI